LWEGVDKFVGCECEERCVDELRVTMEECGGGMCIECIETEVVTDVIDHIVVVVGVDVFKRIVTDVYKRVVIDVLDEIVRDVLDELGEHRWDNGYLYYIL
jgi:hypothetical protein